MVHLALLFDLRKLARVSSPREQLGSVQLLPQGEGTALDTERILNTLTRHLSSLHQLQELFSSANVHMCLLDLSSRKVNERFVEALHALLGHQSILRQLLTVWHRSVTFVNDVSWLRWHV